MGEGREGGRDSGLDRNYKSRLSTESSYVAVSGIRALGQYGIRSSPSVLKQARNLEEFDEALDEDALGAKQNDRIDENSSIAFTYHGFMGSAQRGERRTPQIARGKRV